MKHSLIAAFFLAGLFGGVASACPSDTDGDGMPDVWELKYRTGFDDSDAKDDPDQDGLANIREYKLKTDPMNPDTDGDGAIDGIEVNELGTNPKVAN